MQLIYITFNIYQKKIILLLHILQLYPPNNLQYVKVDVAIHFTAQHSTAVYWGVSALLLITSTIIAAYREGKNI